MVEKKAAQPKKTVELKKTVSDYECPVCLSLCAEPVLTACKHFFCLQCSKAVMKMGMTCPLCRAEFDKNFVPAVDLKLQSEMIQNIP